MNVSRSWKPGKPNENLPGLGRIVRLVRMVRLIPALKSMVYLILAPFGFEGKTLDKPHGKGKERLYCFSSEGGGLEHASFRVI